jgi:glutathione S-transferase
MNATPILYGMPGSLYTAKVRSYLRKQRIAFEERTPGDPRFSKEIEPAVGRWIIPVLQMPDGALLQDGTDIVDHLESLRSGATSGASTGPSASPPDGVLNVVARLLDLYGGEGLLRAAMHFRWNFDADNLAFIQSDFTAALAQGKSADEALMIFAFASGRMRKTATAIGVTPATSPAVEDSLRELLLLLNSHLEKTPYLLGGTPSHADYGLIGPMFAHLARDPHPSSLMKRIAPRVWRWVERMNAPDADAGDYIGPTPAWLDAENPGETLEALLRFVASDYLADIEAHVNFTNDWLAARPELVAGTNGLPRPGDRVIGKVTIAWRGLPMETLVMPYRIFMLQRVQDAADALDARQRQTLDALFARTGLASLLTLRCQRRLERQGHLEVWGPARATSGA